MPRVKGGKIHSKTRKNILKNTKGYKWGRKSKLKVAKTAVKKAGQYAYNSRKTKKREFRALWNNRITAAVRALGTSYSQFIGNLKKNNIELDRKVLSEIAKNNPEIFEQIVTKVTV